MDNSKFHQINQEYQQYYNSLLRKGQLPLRSTEKGFWGHVPAHDLFQAFQKLGLDKRSTFLDLGSGDGKAVLLASLFCKNAIGIEIDPELHSQALKIQKKLGITNAIFHKNDFYNHSIQGVDTVFLYPDEPLHRKLEQKLVSELTGKLIHCGHHFHPTQLKKHSTIHANGTRFTVYSK